MSDGTSGIEAGPREAVERYFEGHVTGDPEVMRRAFHPDARLQFNREGEFGQASLETYLTWLPGQRAEDEGERRRSLERLSVSGDVAVAELELDYPAVRFVDYLTIVRTGERWLITNKVFQAYPKGDG